MPRRMSITHYKGKTEVAAVTNEPIPGLPGKRKWCGNNEVVA